MKSDKAVKDSFDLIVRFQISKVIMTPLIFTMVKSTSPIDRNCINIVKDSGSRLYNITKILHLKISFRESILIHKMCKQ